MITIEKIPLWKDVDPAISIIRYARTDSAVRPAMLAVPGGGYGGVCMSTEGIPIAERFASLGFQVFILNYRVSPNRFPKPQQDIFRAIKLIRANAEAWRVHKDNVAVVGFSAGGHLCVSAGIMYDEVDASAGDAADTESARPDAVLAGYPVITFVGPGHMGSGKNLLGESFEENRVRFSLETRVNENTPPAFLWHTNEDQAVPVANSLLYAEAMRRFKIPCEMHIYPHGQHGMQLGYGREDISAWPEQAKTFLRESCGFKFPSAIGKKTVVLTFDDACKSHLQVVSPILRKYGFGATFFICRFNDEWRAKHEDNLMTAEEVKTLSDQGFEIGNHSWNHPSMNKLTDPEADLEVERLNCFLLDAGVPIPVSFAYPGGPYAENLRGCLSRHAIKVARTANKEAWDVANGDPYKVPAIPIQGEDDGSFLKALELCEDGKPVVLVFHGVPDNVHPWVHTQPEVFEKYMKYLYDNGYSVLSMKDCLKKAN